MAFTLTPAYVWSNGDLVTATRLNLTATPTLAASQSYVFADGTNAAPSIAFASGTTTGLYYDTGVAFAVGGVAKGKVTSTGLNGMDVGTTTPGAGAFTTLSATGVTSLAAGAVGAPGLYLAGDTTTGLYRIGSNNYGFAVSGSKVLDLASTGLAVTGKVSATGELISTGALSAGGASRITLEQQSAGTSRILAWGSDATTTGILSLGVVESDGGGVGGIASISSTGLAVTGAISATTGMSLVSASGDIWSDIKGDGTNLAGIRFFDGATERHRLYNNGSTGLLLRNELVSTTLATFTTFSQFNTVVWFSNYQELTSISTPGSATAGTVRLYADTSAGKIRLMAIFPSGAAQLIATEP